MKRLFRGVFVVIGVVLLVAYTIAWVQGGPGPLAYLVGKLLDVPDQRPPALVAPATDWPVVGDLGVAEFSPDIAGVAAATTLTDPASRLFAATQPTLTTDEAVLREGCKGARFPLPGSRLSGCFAPGVPEGRIYAQRVDNPELAGTSEVTLAHELLHAVWDRMNAEQRAALEAPLEAVFAQGEPVERVELLTAYRDTDRERYLTELHSHIGTEVRVLPPELEEHYAGVFADRQVVVGLWEQSNRSVQAREADLEARYAQLEAQGDQTQAESEALQQLDQVRQAEAEELNAQFTQLDVRDADAVDAYNSRVGQFKADMAADQQRYAALGEAIGAYNAAADEYDRLAGELTSLYDQRGINWG
ncbi:hypothetical protein GCM10009785_10300 [Brooklawnia cerclae]|uniref:Uncharacterized protein n=1 Tax=Brooklawnia cerclae TaxID=349934 RepID=A0ABX0SKF9_9ACTN|nr:hypothetical protein [Brooklawnia cerclae]NIH58865.1 hypothetical protein [Brooklawnia cerclae]